MYTWIPPNLYLPGIWFITYINTFINSLCKSLLYTLIIKISTETHDDLKNFPSMNIDLNFVNNIVMNIYYNDWKKSSSYGSS